MENWERTLKTRLNWVRLYADTGNAGFVCRRCGVPRPTLRKWWRRYQDSGNPGLLSKSRRPRSSPRQKITLEIEEWILELRVKRKLGPGRIQAELLRLHDCKLSTASIWKVLKRYGTKRLSRRRLHKVSQRYSKPLPGEMVQVDSCKIAPGLYQFTAIDDCTRYRVLGLYRRRSAKNAVHFLVERMIEEFPFPIQRIQSDRGSEFFGLSFQKKLRECHIKFRPIRPGSPHLNGKVERSQLTDLLEFYALEDVSAPELEEHLFEWQHFYNWYRPHGAFGGITPMDRLGELHEKTPWSWEVYDRYDPVKEGFRERNYYLDLRPQRLKRCV